MIGVIGSGSWATAIVKILLETNETICWWVREPEIREGLMQFGHNPFYLSQVNFDVSRIRISGSLEEVVRDSQDLMVVVPAAFLSVTFAGFTPQHFIGKNIHSAVKGIVPETNQVVVDYFMTTFGLSVDAMSVVSGPSHAEEVVQEKLTYLAVASMNASLAEKIANQLACHYVQAIPFKDIYGIEYAAVLKNIYALSAGICKGIGYGDNLIAVLISKALQEMQHFICSMYKMEICEFERFPYLGDLLVTAYSQHSRNRVFGNMIGSGYSVKSAQLEMNMIAEGYYAVRCIHFICQENKIRMPIVEAVYAILYEEAAPKQTMKDLVENLS